MPTDFTEKGQMTGSVIGLIIGVGISIVLLIVLAIIAAKAYEISESDLTSIDAYDGNFEQTGFSATDANIQDSVLSSIRAGFDALEVSGEYMPLIVIAVVLGVIISTIVLSFGLTGGGRGPSMGQVF